MRGCVTSGQHLSASEIRGFYGAAWQGSGPDGWRSADMGRLRPPVATGSNRPRLCKNVVSDGNQLPGDFLGVQEAQLLLGFSVYNLIRLGSLSGWRRGSHV